MGKLLEIIENEKTVICCHSIGSLKSLMRILDSMGYIFDFSISLLTVEYFKPNMCYFAYISNNGSKRVSACNVSFFLEMDYKVYYYDTDRMKQLIRDVWN
jgi:hypothetical protein